MLTSFLIESVILAVAGGAIGEVLAILLSAATGLDDRTMRVGAFVFSSAFTFTALGGGIVTALLIGAAGGILPAWRAAHLPIVESLREA